MAHITPQRSFGREFKTFMDDDENKDFKKQVDAISSGDVHEFDEVLRASKLNKRHNVKDI